MDWKGKEVFSTQGEGFIDAKMDQVRVDEGEKGRGRGGG